MKQFAKRSLSMLLALVMCLGFFSGIALPEAEAASYVYNWGSRGTVADEDDFARSTAEEWYAAEGTSYEELSQYTGSATTSSVTSSSMYQQLRSLMRGAVTDTTSYDDIKTLCKYTDCQNGGGSISSFYTGKAIGPSWDGSWNREHVWPNSKGDANGSGENCIFMLRPTTVAENSSRGNEAFGEGSSYYNPNEESGGTYDLRGDVARIILFVYVRWQDYNSSAAVLYGTSGVIESRAVLLKWMEEDPVDTWELGRNDSCQSITGTRNVFVDYPELAFLMLGADIPSDYTSPSGAGNAVSYNITATSNNTSYGTVSLSGKTITATPKTGYYVSGYTVTGGSATVVQTGNTFKVTPNSDCTIRINFAAKTAVTLTFMENGISAKTVSAYGGDTVTLPSNTNTVAEGYTFLGWTDALVSDTTTKPAIYTAGSTVTASNKTYYALYSRMDGANSSGNWTLVDSTTDLRAGDQYILAHNSSGKVAGGLNGKYLDPLDATFSSDKKEITSLPSGAMPFTLGGSTGAWTLTNEDGNALGCTTEKTMLLGTESKWTITISGGTAMVKTTAGTLQYNTSAPRFTTYSNASQQNLNLYTMGGTVYYTTSTFVCEHEDTTDVPAEAATCTQTGYTAGVYCNNCDQFISGCEEIAALGHSWGAWVQTTAPDCTNAGVETATCSRCSETKTQAVAATGHSYNSVVTAPTETQQGYTTHTCSVCGDSYVDSYTDALGQTFYVSFSVPEDVTAIATMACGKNGITLPAAAAPEGYTFLGWTTAPVEDTETKPTVLTGTYTATANITLYAIYSYVESEGEQANGVYTLYSGEITEGDYVIEYSKSALVAADADGSGRMDYKTVSITNNTITDPDSTIIWHIAPTADGYYTIYNEANGVYAAGTGAKNKSTVLTSVTDYAKWTPTGTTTYEFKNLGNANKGVNAMLRLNGTYGFACYSTSTGGALNLYKGNTGTTYYTTLTVAEPAVELTHISLDPANDALGFKAAATNLPEGAQIAIRLWVTEDRVITKSLSQDSIALRLKNILAYGGGETTIYAQAVILVDGEEVAASAVESTTMRDTIVAVNENWSNYSSTQQNAVKTLYNKYSSVISAWLGEDNKIA